MAEWNYGDALESLPPGVRTALIGGDPVDLPNGSRVQTLDWLASDPPEWLTRADRVVVDPPWNMGNMRAFYTKAGKPWPSARSSFTDDALPRLWTVLDAIGPRDLFFEIGKDHLADVIMAARPRFRFVTFYDCTYYHRSTNRCHMVHASNRRGAKRRPAWEGLDESDLIERILVEDADWERVADPCMGLGLVGRNAVKAGKPFVGTELNPRRLAHLVRWCLDHAGDGGAGDDGRPTA